MAWAGPLDEPIVPDMPEKAADPVATNSVLKLGTEVGEPESLFIGIF